MIKLCYAPYRLSAWASRVVCCRPGSLILFQLWSWISGEVRPKLGPTMLPQVAIKRKRPVGAAVAPDDVGETETEAQDALDIDEQLGTLQVSSDEEDSEEEDSEEVQSDSSAEEEEVEDDSSDSSEELTFASEDEGSSEEDDDVDKVGDASRLSSTGGGAELPEGGEYAEGDTSDEEDIRNTIGNIPINWYDDFDHIGYDWSGQKILKPEQGDQLDEFLKKIEDPLFWRKVRNMQTGQDVVLSDGDVELIKRLEGHKIPDEGYDDYAPWVEWFSSQVMEMPLRAFPEHKRSFLPSRDEMKKVSKYVHALKMGWMKTKRAMKAKAKSERKSGPQFYLLWKTDDVAEEMRRIDNNIPAPKRPLPDHSESYNPPEEFLFNEREKKKWERERKSLGNRKLHFVPQKFKSLREVPSYRRFVRERFMRCLDLYMCPRAIKMKLTIEPEELVPQLPSPADLQPFPTMVALVFKGHEDMVRSIGVDPTGQFLASASDDGTVRFWEISTGRCLRTVTIGGTARSVAWNPSPQLTLLAVAADRQVHLINSRLGSSDFVKQTDELLNRRPAQDKVTPPRVEAAVQWDYLNEGDLFDAGVLVTLNHFKEVRQVQWHGKGDYLFSLMPDGENRSILVHHLSRGRSQTPFNRSRGLIQAACFHPIKPQFIVATQRNVRIYDLVKQEMIRKLITSSKWISGIAAHSGGDHLLVSTYDRKVLWFDLELSIKPYKTLSLHSQAVRAVAYHRRYPLFASVSDDQSLIISHGMVYNDLLQNALIVPLKRFSSHRRVNDFSMLDVTFHPHQPWVFTSGADGNIVLYT